MVDALKIAIKAGLVIAITLTIIALFTVVEFPATDLTPLQEAVGTGKAIMDFWLPEANVWFIFGIVLLGLKASILIFKIAATATKWILKVNE